MNKTPEAYIWYCDCGWHQEYNTSIILNECPMCKSVYGINSVSGSRQEMDEVIQKIDKKDIAFLSLFKQKQYHA